MITIQVEPQPVNPGTLHQNNDTACPSYINFCLMLLCWTRYTAVQINNYLKRTFAIKVTTMKITDNFHYNWKPATKLSLFTVSKDELDTKEGTSKSMKNAFYVQWYGKDTSRAEAISSNNKKINSHC